MGIVVDFCNGDCDLWVKNFGYVRIFVEDLDTNLFQSKISMNDIVEIGHRITFSYKQSAENHVVDIKLVDKEAQDKLKKSLLSIGTNLRRSAGKF